MKMKIVTIAIGLLLAISAARGNQILSITEFEAPGGDVLLVRLDGHPIPGVLIGGSEDNWVITLPMGFSISESAVQSTEVAEPDQPSDPELGTVNFIDIFPPGEIDFTSEFINPTSHPPAVVTIEDAGMGPFGPFDFRFEDVPESSSTLGIFGIGLAGLSWFARFRRTAR
jgi:hypothetical protein